MGTCLVCNKLHPIAKWGVFLGCIPQLEVDMLVKDFNVMALKDQKGTNWIVELFMAQENKLSAKKLNINVEKRGCCPLRQ